MDLHKDNDFRGYGMGRYWVKDDFLDTYDALKAYSQYCDFEDIPNPVDGVVYPHICREIPDFIQWEIELRLNDFVGRKIENPTIFMRMSPSGVHVPHIVHTDNSMGSHSLMLYMNDADGGTGFARHKETGMHMAPESEQLLQIAIDDCNKPDKWIFYDQAKMRENRAVIFDASLFHCALPIGGFGETQSDARIVLTAFFS